MRLLPALKQTLFALLVLRMVAAPLALRLRIPKLTLIASLR